LLEHYFHGFYVVENVRPYYEYLIEPSVMLGRHPYWTNFYIAAQEFSSDGIKDVGAAEKLAEKFGYDLSGYDLPDKRKALRNAVNPQMGLYILQSLEKLSTEVIHRG
jgi:hypothetical protein